MSLSKNGAAYVHTHTHTHTHTHISTLCGPLLHPCGRFADLTLPVHGPWDSRVCVCVCVCVSVSYLCLWASLLERCELAVVAPVEQETLDEACALDL